VLSIKAKIKSLDEEENLDEDIEETEENEDLFEEQSGQDLQEDESQDDPPNYIDTSDDGEELAPQEMNEESAQEGYNKAYLAHFYYYYAALRGIIVKGIKTGCVIPPNHIFNSASMQEAQKVFINEIEYANDVLIEFSDMSLCFWNQSLANCNRIVVSYDEIKRKGFQIVSVPTPYRAFKHQKVQYLLWQKGKPFPKGGSICHAQPVDVVIKLDQNRKAIRLEGPNCKYGSVGDWVKFSEFVAGKTEQRR
jgi:hypothetical protein